MKLSCISYMMMIVFKKWSVSQNLMYFLSCCGYQVQRLFYTKKKFSDMVHHSNQSRIYQFQKKMSIIVIIIMRTKSLECRQGSMILHWRRSLVDWVCPVAPLSEIHFTTQLQVISIVSPSLSPSPFLFLMDNTVCHKTMTGSYSAIQEL